MSSVPTTPAASKGSGDDGDVGASGIGLSLTNSTPSPSTSLVHPTPAPTPPPQAFQSLPLSSGTIHPPSFSTPTKLQHHQQHAEKSSFSKNDSTGNDSSSGESSVITASTSTMTTTPRSSSSTSSLENNHHHHNGMNKKDEPTSTVASPTVRSSSATVTTNTKVKGIDEFLNSVHTIDHTEVMPKSRSNSATTRSNPSVSADNVVNVDGNTKKKLNQRQSAQKEKETSSTKKNSTSSGKEASFEELYAAAGLDDDEDQDDNCNNNNNGKMPIDGKDVLNDKDSNTPKENGHVKTTINGSGAVTAVKTPKTGNIDRHHSHSSSASTEGEGQNGAPPTTAATTTTTTTTTATNRIEDKNEDNDNDNINNIKTDSKSLVGESSSVSSSISNSRSLIPRSLDSSSHKTGSKKLFNMDLSLRAGSGSRSPSILSSQEESSKESREAIEKNMNRMKHLGLLLDRHNRQIKMRRRNSNVVDDDWWQNDSNNRSQSSKEYVSSSSKGEKTSIESSEEGRNEGLTGYSIKSSDGSNTTNYPDTSKSGMSSMTSPIKRRASMGASSVSSSGLDGPQTRFGRRLSLTSTSSGEMGRKISDTLFDNFDKTWQSFHMTSEARTQAQSSNEVFKREQICFASMVLVLLQREQNKPTDSKTAKTKSVPLDIVKLFWEEVILSKKKENVQDQSSFKVPDDCNVHSLTENIADFFLNKLHYITVETEVPSVQSIERGDTSTLRIKLSHDVYLEYSKHILESYANNDSQKMIRQWSAKFIDVLKDYFLTDNKDEDTGGKVSHEIINYAASQIPKLILQSFHTLNDGHQQFQKDRVGYFVSLMRNFNFLSKRMSILGATVQKQKDGQKQVKVETYAGKAKFDILQATKAHIEDLESIHSVISLMPDETTIETEGGTFGVTEAILSMYNAWKDLCLSIIQYPKNTGDGTDSIKSSTSNSSTEYSKSQSHYTNHRARKENKLQPMIQASETTQSTLPKHFRLVEGEYKLMVDGFITSLEMIPIVNKKTDRVRRGTLKRSDSKRKPKKATMKLPDVLKIDPALLYHYLSVGKSINLLAKSISDASLSNPDGRSTGSGPKSLTGTMPNVSSIGFSIAAIDIYMQLAHIMSFILSKDVGDVDEDDLIDVGYYYDKDSKNVDPSSRLKKLFKDRNEARSLMELLNILCAESWLAIGSYVLVGLSEGNESRIEMSAISLLNHLDEDAVSDVDPSNVEVEETPQSRARLLDEDFKSTLQFKVLLCFQMALGILLHNSSFDKKGNRGFQSELTNAVVHERNLKASIIHSIGVYYYEQVGDYQRAKVCFDSSLASRRLLLRLLQREEPDDLGSLSSSSIGSRSMQRSYKRSYQRSSRHTNGRHKTKRKTQEEHVDSEKSNQIDDILSLEKTRKKQVALTEKGLSTTLEFSALASHCLLDYETSLSLFQEALILRALYSGKDSLEVANLQYNMGVVHDDLAQYEASLGRYGESLRVRYTLLERFKHDFSIGNNTLSSSTLELLDVEASVVLTLRCMGNVYRALKDVTNSIGCLMKAVEILKDKLKRQITDSSIGIYQSLDGDIGFGKGMVGPFLILPMPNIILEELKCKGKNISHHVKSFDDFSGSTKSSELGEDDMVRKDIASMYTTIISLVNERIAQGSNMKIKSGYTSSGSYSSSSSPVRGIRSVHKKEKKGLEATSDNDSIILDSTFNLGLLALHFKEHKNALHYFEEALRTLWTSFTGDSSGESSDSDFSSSKSSGNPSTVSKTKVQKSYFDGQVEEGALYHALAIAHASLSDHERAIRCYVTALRYYRRRLGLESSKVAGALYDCAYSYWKLNDFEKAEDFWADCLKILLSCNGIIDSKGNNNKSSVSPLYDFHVARTLYNLAASKICKDEYDDQYIETCLNDATSILQRLSNKKTARTFNNEIGHCYFYSGFVHYKRSLTMISATKRKSSENLHGSSAQMKMKELKCREGELHHASSFVDDSLNSYLAENGSVDVGLEEVEVGQKVQHPMQGHIAHLSAWIHDALGSVTQAQWNYKTAVRLLNKVYSPQNIYSASAMHSLGNLYTRIGSPSEALKCFEDSLVCRAKILGSDHAAVADTLFEIAAIIGNVPDYHKATAMYTHCLKIRIMCEGNDGENVANTLLQLALLHEKRGYLRRSQEYLEGALKVRRSRVHIIIHGCIVNVEEAVEGGNSEVQEIERVTREEQIKLAIVLQHLGNVILKTGNTRDAMNCYEEALNIRRKLCGMSTLGFAEYMSQSDLDGSIDLNRTILHDMADTLHNIGGVYETTNMPQKALGCYNQALIIKRSISKDKKVEFSLEDQIKSCNTLSSAITLLRIGTIHNQLHDYDVALSYYKSALSIQRQHLGRDHIAVAQTLAEMGLILFNQLDNPVDISTEEKAALEVAVIKRFNEALRISRLCHGPDHVSVAGVMYSIGSIHHCKGEYNKAIDYFQHSVKVYGRQYATNLCRTLFDISSPQRNRYDEIVDDNHGLFHPTSFMSNLSPLEDRTRLIFSRSTTINSSTVNDIDREAYMKASLALAKVASRSGFVVFHGSVFQGLFLKLIHFIATNGVDPIKGSLREGLVKMMKNFSRACSQAIVTEAPQSNYLYLIQE